MSETEKSAGKIQLRPRLENETDKGYFERVTDRLGKEQVWYSGDVIEKIISKCNAFQEDCNICTGDRDYCCFECESLSGKNLSDEILNIIESECE